MIYEYLKRTKTPPHMVYKLHQEVMNTVYGAGHGLDKQAVRPIWRSHKNGEETVVLIRSSQRPLGIDNYTENPFRVENDKSYKFNARLNTCKRCHVEDPTHPRGTRIVEKCIAHTDINIWLRDLLGKNGMEIQNAAISGQAKISIKNNAYAIATDIIFFATVTDKQLAQRAYNCGLGRKKAFGLGLMLEIG